MSYCNECENHDACDTGCIKGAALRCKEKNSEGPTPRTDAKQFSIPLSGGNHNVVFAEHARQLERELAFHAFRHAEAESLLRQAAQSAKPMMPEVTDAWAEKFCELVNWHPDGTENKVVEGVFVSVTFRELAKGYIRSALAAVASGSEREGQGG